MTDYRDDIDKIIDWFDFERVHRVMTELDWRWGASPGEVPEIPELRQAARRLMNEAVRGMEQANSEKFSILTGGFVVRVNRDPEDGKIWIRLGFELTSWDNYE